MSDKKPQDLLEFLRQASPTEETEAAPAPVRPVAPPPAPARPEMVLVRKSQIVIAGVAAGLAVLLALLLGLALGGDGEAAAVADAETRGVWVVRVITYDDTEQGLLNAKSIVGDLEQLGWDEVNLQRIPSQGKLAVTLGSWLKRPARNPTYEALLKQVRDLTLTGGEQPFRSAHLWRIQR